MNTTTIFECRKCHRKEPEVQHSCHGLCRGCYRIVQYHTQPGSKTCFKYKPFLKHKQARVSQTKKRVSAITPNLEEHLRKLYAEGKSLHMIANELGTSYTYVHREFTRLKIRKRTHQQSSYIMNNLTCMRNTTQQLISEEKEILYGTLLGDASIPEPIGSNECCLLMSHCVKQKPYLDWLSLKLKEFRPQETSANWQQNGELTLDRGYNWRTSHLPLFTQLRNVFYVNNKKIVTQSILNELTPLSLAVWYMDDGYLHHIHRSTSVSYTAHLCIHGFTKIENELIAQHLCNQWQLDCKAITDNHKWITKQGENKQQTYYMIRFTTESTKRFFALIRPHIHPSMLYKLAN